MLCSLSGTEAGHPVVNTKTGHVYEQSLIDKYLKTHTTCPVTGQAMSPSDLIPIVGNSSDSHGKTSVPSLLKALQDEWDNVVLSTYELKQEYLKARQELSNALYENDAAARVIARLIKERDELKNGITATEPASKEPVATDVVEQSMEVDQEHFPREVIERIESLSAELSQARRANKSKSTEISLVESKSESSSTLSSLEVMGDKTIAVGDSVVIHGDKKATLKDSKNVLVAHALGERILTGGKAIKLYALNRTWKPEWNVKEEVTDLSVHPSNQYFLSVSGGSWDLRDAADGDVITSHHDVETEYTSVAFHPDGLIFATGSVDGHVKIWDLKTKTVAFECPETHNGKVKLSFSENGYYFATAGSDDSCVKVWDLRKLVKSTEIAVDQPVRDIKFDSTGQFLAVCHSKLQIFIVKQWTQVYERESSVSCVAFGKDSMVTGGDDTLTHFNRK